MIQPVSLSTEFANGPATSAPAHGLGSGDASRAQLPVCLISLVHADRGLSHALLSHLRGELPELEFTFENDREVHCVWLCGYEPESADFLRALRERHPHAIILATRRGPLEDWEAGAREAGADHACAWPASYQELGLLLRTR